MAEQSPVEFRLWRRFQDAAAGAIIVALMIAGCHRAQTSADSEPQSSDVKAAGGTPANSSTGSNGAGSDRVATLEKTGSGAPSESVLPPPKFVKRKVVTAQFPDKTPQATWNVKVFSDGSEVYDGPHTEFYFNGKKLMDGQYVEGKQEGKWTFWSETGKLLKTETYRKGKLDGAWTLFRENGSKERDVSYKSGKRDGKWIFYDAAGKNQPVEQHEYKASDLKTADNPDGTWIKWNRDGKKLSEIHYKDGLVDGTETLWYPNGKIQEVQTFKNGLPDGKRIRWKQNGEKIDESDFQNGRPVAADSSGDK